jgi:hypothetical protein
VPYGKWLTPDTRELTLVKARTNNYRPSINYHTLDSQVQVVLRPSIQPRRLTINARSNRVNNYLDLIINTARARRD